MRVAIDCEYFDKISLYSFDLYIKSVAHIYRMLSPRVYHLDLVARIESAKINATPRGAPV